MKLTAILSALMLTTFTFSAIAAGNTAATTETSASMQNKKKAEIKEVVFNVGLHCENCVKKVTENISFEKGVKDLKVSLEDQTVTVKFDAAKTSEETLKAAIQKLGYPVSAKVVSAPMANARTTSARTASARMTTITSTNIKNDIMYEILTKEMLTPTICRMTVFAPRLASAAQPGQFLIVRADEHGERIPLTISDYDKEKGTVSIVTQQIGASTTQICALEEGEAFADVVGPLGVPSEFTEMSSDQLSAQRYIFIAGGVGTAPVYPQVKWLHERGVAVDVIIGAKNADLVIYKDEMEAVCDNLFICTDDGSAGFKGLVTAMLEKLIAEGRTYTQAVAIGPMIMMKFATLTARKLNLPIIVSLNTLMVDGTGMCGACRVSVAGKTRFACVEGPEFNGYDVDFDEAMRRQGMYKAEEIEADHKCKIGRG